MDILVFVLLAAALWFLPGIVIAALCMCSGRMRAAVLRRSRESLERSVRQRLAERRVSEAMAEYMLKRNQSRLPHLLAAPVGIILMGPKAIDWFRALRKQLPP